MTLNDLLKRVSQEERDKVIIFTDGNGWTNVDYVSPADGKSATILLKASSNSTYSDEE